MLNIIILLDYCIFQFFDEPILKIDFYVLCDHDIYKNIKPIVEYKWQQNTVNMKSLQLSLRLTN